MSDQRPSAPPATFTVHKHAGWISVVFWLEAQEYEFRFKQDDAALLVQKLLDALDSAPLPPNDRPHA